MWFEIIDAAANVVFTVVVPAIIVGVGTMLGKRYKDETLKADVLKNIENAVDIVQDEYAVWRKRAHADGKLTAEERAEALALAKTKAVAIAQGPAAEIIKNLAVYEFNSIVKRILAARK